MPNFPFLQFYWIWKHFNTDQHLNFSIVACNAVVWHCVKNCQLLFWFPSARNRVIAISIAKEKACKSTEKHSLEARCVHALPLHLQDAQHAPPTLAFHSPTGTTLALLHLLGQADAGIHLHQASTAMEAAGLASQHKWGIILPTSARVANSIYEPAIATIYPTLCQVHDKQ